MKLYAFSRPRRAVTAKKCRKKRDARAGLLFSQSKPRPIAFFFFAVFVDVIVVVA